VTPNPKPNLISNPNLN